MERTFDVLAAQETELLPSRVALAVADLTPMSGGHDDGGKFVWKDIDADIDQKQDIDAWLSHVTAVQIATQNIH